MARIILKIFKNKRNGQKTAVLSDKKFSMKIPKKASNIIIDKWRFE